MATSQLSQQAYDRLKEELADRSGARRREISAWIERAREHGDIRENADYDAAKNEQGPIEERSDTFEVLSTESPLGRALLDHGPGDTVSYEGPRRTFAVEIVSVRP